MEGMPEPLEALYAKKRVYIPKVDALSELRERGFGSLEKGRLVLSPYEVFYLVEKGRIKVSQGNTAMTLQDLVGRLSLGKPEIWIKYLVYRDLRDRGYIVRESREADFEVHGKGALRRLVSIVYEGLDAKLSDLSRSMKVALEERKEFILAVVDRRTDIVFYSLSELSF